MAARLKPTSPLGVIARAILPILASVNFDHEPPLQANEVYDVWPNDVLSPELVDIELPQTQVLPESTLGIGQ